MKIIFFGTFQYAVPALERLIKAGYEIVAVVTNPDSFQGRKKELVASPVKLAAQQYGLTVFQPPSLKIGKLENYLEIENFKLKIKSADLGIVVAYSKIIPKEILGLFPKGVLNIHPSLLPLYRGPSPIQSAILNGEKETGVTIMQIDEEVDHGAILSQAKYVIPPEALHPQIAMEIFQLGAELLIKTIPDWLAGKIIPQPQEHTCATFTKKFSWENGRIDWNQPAEKIYNQIRALNPEPGTWTTWKRGFQVKILKILKAEIGEDGKVLPQEVQPEGKKAMPFQDFLRGVGQKELDFK